MKTVKTSGSDSYSYSSTQINLPKNISQKIKNWGRKNIPEKNIYKEDGERTFGREDEIHITVKYGLHTINPEDIKSKIGKFKQFDVELGEISRFTPAEENYDVVKIAINGEELGILHKLIGELENSDKHPVYKPHCTIAYVKKGTHSDLSGNLDLSGTKFTVSRITFNSKDGQSSEIDLI